MEVAVAFSLDARGARFPARSKLGAIRIDRSNLSLRAGPSNYHQRQFAVGVRAEQLLLPLFIGVYGLFLLMGCVKPIQWNGMFLAAAAFCVCILLSIWYGSAALHHTVLLSDFFELPKAWLPVILLHHRLRSGIIGGLIER